MDLNKIKLTLIEDSLFVGKIDDKNYFSKDYSSFVSNSRLGNINPKQDGSPDKFFNPSTKFFSDSLILGSACHVKVLQDELFDLVQIDRPNAKLGFVCDHIWDFSKNHKLSDEAIKYASDTVGYYKDKLSLKVVNGIQDAYLKYYGSRINIKEKENVETMYLSPKIYETATNCIQACKENKQFQKLLKPEGLLEDPISENEQAFTVGIKCEFPDRDPIILKLKAKLDNYTIDLENNTIVVNDLKTIGSVLPKFDQGDDCNFKRFRYGRELAEYIMLLKLYVKQKYNMINPTIHSNCLVVSTIPDYYTKVYRVTAKDILDGFNELRLLLRLVAYYIAYEGYKL